MSTSATKNTTLSFNKPSSICPLYKILIFSLLYTIGLYINCPRYKLAQAVLLGVGLLVGVGLCVLVIDGDIVNDGVIDGVMVTVFVGVFV
jgi:hypothetical protein